MANNSHVNKYAKALFNASLENNSLTDVRESLIAIVKIAKTVPEFNHVLLTKSTSISNKKNILSNILNEHVNPLVTELLIILIDNDQIQLFTNIMNKYNQLMNMSSKELDVLITSKMELSEDDLNSVKTDLSSKLNKQINIKNNVDHSIIGGIKLRIGNTIIDNSLSKKLMKLKNNLKNNHANME
tara:strand:- start:2724 stop:3278 length:555 start_codon:yes stop_codon:yes gene_type:complete